MWVSRGANDRGIHSCRKTMPPVLTALPQGRISVGDMESSEDVFMRAVWKATNEVDNTAWSFVSSTSWLKYVKADALTGL